MVKKRFNTLFEMNLEHCGRGGEEEEEEEEEDEE